MSRIKRDPTIHIKKSDLVKILSDIQYFRMTNNNLANKIFEKAGPYQLKNRCLVYGNKKVTSKLERINGVTDNDVKLFNRILDSVRRVFHHKGITVIKQGSRDYLSLVDVTKLANEFRDDFDIKLKKEAYSLFCETGIAMMGRKYSINRFKTYYKHICQKTQAKVDVLYDDNPEGTQEVYLVWYDCMLKYGGVDIDVKRDEFEKYVWFVDARKKADEYDAAYEDWIIAQFEAMSYLNTVPELIQLSNEKSVNRYTKYMTELQTDDLSEARVSGSEGYFNSLKKD